MWPSRTWYLAVPLVRVYFPKAASESKQRRVKQAHSRNDFKTTERMIKTGLWQKQGKDLRLDKKIVFSVVIYGDQFFQADSALL